MTKRIRVFCSRRCYNSSYELINTNSFIVSLFYILFAWGRYFYWWNVFPATFHHRVNGLRNSFEFVVCATRRWMTHEREETIHVNIPGWFQTRMRIAVQHYSDIIDSLAMQIQCIAFRALVHDTRVNAGIEIIHVLRIFVGESLVQPINTRRNELFWVQNTHAVWISTNNLQLCLLYGTPLRDTLKTSRISRWCSMRQSLDHYREQSTVLALVMFSYKGHNL